MEQPRDHIVAVPAFFQTIRMVQLVLAAVVLALSAFGLSSLSWLGGAYYSVFVSIATFIIGGWYLLSTLRVPTLYNKIAVLILECFLVIWWLSCWANLAAWAAAYTIVDTPYCDVYGTCVGAGLTAYRTALAVAAAVGALNWVLFLTTLVVFSIHFHRSRLAGAPYAANGTWRNGAPNGSGQGGQAEQKPVPMQPQKPAGFQPQAVYVQQVPQPPMPQYGVKV